MSTAALYDILSSFKDIHKVVLNLAADLNDKQLNWKPDGYSTIRNLFLSLVMEKKPGKRKILPKPGDFLKVCIKQLGPA